MVVLRNKCEKCLEFMKVEKVGEDYFLTCPNCEKMKEKDEYDFSG
ncbi:Uncharacterised protein [uncultured archaeon]|nr:Uncharacterised protein [uncultured archaeon]